jgi:hypothetical protein
MVPSADSAAFKYSLETRCLYWKVLTEKSDVWLLMQLLAANYSVPRDHWNEPPQPTTSTEHRALKKMVLLGHLFCVGLSHAACTSLCRGEYSTERGSKPTVCVPVYVKERHGWMFWETNLTSDTSNCYSIVCNCRVVCVKNIHVALIRITVLSYKH